MNHNLWSSVWFSVTVTYSMFLIINRFRLNNVLLIWLQTFNIHVGFLSNFIIKVCSLKNFWNKTIFDLTWLELGLLLTTNDSLTTAKFMNWGQSCKNLSRLKSPKVWKCCCDNLYKIYNFFQKYNQTLGRHSN